MRKKTRKKIQIITMVIILAIFNIFILTMVINKNYTSFAVLDVENTDNLDPELEKVILATKACDELKNSQEEICSPAYVYSLRNSHTQSVKICAEIREYCYYGIGHALGYNIMDTKLCDKLEKVIQREFCYAGIGEKIGRGDDTKRFEEYFQICRDPLCSHFLFRGKKNLEDCEDLSKEYKGCCYFGVGENLLAKYKLEEAIGKCQISENYGEWCMKGLSFKTGKLKLPVIDLLENWFYYSGLGITLGQEESKDAFKTCEEIEEGEYEQACKISVASIVGAKNFEKANPMP